jgi:hypothetical protein
MMAKQERERGTGSVYKSRGLWVGAIPVSHQPPTQVSGTTKKEATEKLDAHLDGKTILHIPVPKTLGEEATAKATENDTTLPRLLEPEVTNIIQKYIAGDGEQES